MAMAGCLEIIMEDTSGTIHDVFIYNLKEKTFFEKFSYKKLFNANNIPQLTI